MKTKYVFLSLALAAMLFFSPGCLEDTPRQASVMQQSVLQSEKIIRQLEELSGNTLSKETIDRLDGTANKFDKALRVVRGGMAFGASIPTPASPFLAIGATVLGLIGTGVQTFRGFLARRRARRLEMGLDAVVVAVDDVPGIGAKIGAIAKARGVADVVEASYVVNRVS